MADAPASFATSPTPKKKFGRELVVRTASALVLAPIAVFCVWTGGIAYLALITLALIIGLYEWIKLTRFGVLGVLGVIYLTVNLAAFIWLRATPEIGRELTFYVLLSVWAVDIGAYFAGRLIGGPKLAPKFSPSKTWAGLFGGMVSAALIGYAWAYVAGARTPELALLIGAVISVVAQIGDIMESALKRRAGAKDSGTIIPGHGGVLDRIDGLLLAVPFFVLFHLLVGIRLQWW